MALIRFVFIAYPLKTHAFLNLQGGKCWTKIVKFQVFSSGPNTWPGSGNEGFYHINDWSWPILSGWPKQIVSCHQTIVYDGATLWTRVFHGFFRSWKVYQCKYLLCIMEEREEDSEFLESTPVLFLDAIASLDSGYVSIGETKKGPRECPGHPR